MADKECAIMGSVYAVVRGKRDYWLAQRMLCAATSCLMEAGGTIRLEFLAKELHKRGNHRTSTTGFSFAENTNIPAVIAVLNARKAHLAGMHPHGDAVRLFIKTRRLPNRSYDWNWV